MAVVLTAPGGTLACAQQSSQSGDNQDIGFVLKTNSELVLTNVVVRDAKTGEFVRGPNAKRFTVYENGKKQQISTFDYQSVEMAKPLNEATVSGLAAGPSGSKAVIVAKPEDLLNHRLIVMFFDLTSMQPEDLDRSVEAAQAFLKTKMEPADLVALVSLGDTLKGGPGFYGGQECADQRSGRVQRDRGAGVCAGRDRELESGRGHDRLHARRERIQRLEYGSRAICVARDSKSLEKITEKKSLLYFSGGISRDGIENQASLRAAINAAVRANLSIYSVDTRGLQAISPLGDASTGSLRGSGAYNGGRAAE